MPKDRDTFVYPPRCGRPGVFEARRIPVEGPVRRPARGSAWREQIDAYLEDCFRRESPPRVKELAHFLELSRSYLHRVFAETWRTTPSRYLRREEVLVASRLLRGSALKETRVAYKAGFGTRRTLFRAFQKTLRMTPSAYRAMVHAGSKGGPNVATLPIPKPGKAGDKRIGRSPSNETHESRTSFVALAKRPRRARPERNL